jgi:plasmid stabilization system protein ParE
MARRIIWAPKATKDFLAAIDFIESASLLNARRVADRVLKRVESLALTATGRPGRVPGTFEAYVPRTSLIIAFELPDKGRLHILRIIHVARDWREGEWPP